MKLIGKLLVFACLVGLLTACSNLTDMIGFLDDNNENNDTHVMENNNNENMHEENEENNVDEMNESNEEEDNTVINESNEEEADNNEDASTNSGMSNACEDESEKVLGKMNTDFFIPDCAIVTSMTSIDDGFKAKLTIEGADWEDILDEYLEAYADQITKEDKQFARDTGTINIAFAENHSINIMSTQYENDVEVRLTYKDKEEE